MQVSCAKTFTGAPCGVLAIGRCITCGDAFCGSHQHIEVYFVDSLETTRAIVNLCAACGDEKRKRQDALGFAKKYNLEGDYHQWLDAATRTKLRAEVFEAAYAWVAGTPDEVLAAIRAEHYLFPRSVWPGSKLGHAEVVLLEEVGRKAFPLRTQQRRWTAEVLGPWFAQEALRRGLEPDGVIETFREIWTPVNYVKRFKRSPGWLFPRGSTFQYRSSPGSDPQPATAGIRPDGSVELACFHVESKRHQFRAGHGLSSAAIAQMAEKFALFEGAPQIPDTLPDPRFWHWHAAG